MMYPKFRISAIPNGGSRNVREAVNLKHSGVMAGEPDLLLRLPNGITINMEIKTDKGRLSDYQKEFYNFCKLNNHYYFVVRSVDEFDKIIQDFL
ncbi:MAG: VRR-NUC domain-containing protein [Chitinophagaceae bacterium]